VELNKFFLKDPSVNVDSLNQHFLFGFLSFQVSFSSKKTHVIIAVVWLFAATYECLSLIIFTDIVDGVCLPFQVWPSWIVSRIVPWAVAAPVEYVGPIVVMVFCYGRIYLNLRSKVSLIFCWPRGNT
jgi:hypothetical protein